MKNLMNVVRWKVLWLLPHQKKRIARLVFLFALGIGITASLPSVSIAEAELDKSLLERLKHGCAIRGAVGCTRTDWIEGTYSEELVAIKGELK